MSIPGLRYRKESTKPQDKSTPKDCRSCGVRPGILDMCLASGLYMSKSRWATLRSPVNTTDFRCFSSDKYDLIFGSL